MPPLFLVTTNPDSPLSKTRITPGDTVTSKSEQVDTEVVVQQPDLWNRVYSDAAGNAFGVVIGLAGGILGVIWLTKVTGISEAIKDWHKSFREQTDSIKEMASAITALKDSLGKMEERTISFEKELVRLNQVQTIVTHEIREDIRDIQGKISELQGEFRKSHKP